MKKNFGSLYGRICSKTCVGTLIAAVTVCIIVWGLSVIGDVFGMMPGKGSMKMINIPSGASVSRISHILKDEGVIRHPFVFRVYEKFGVTHIFQQGGHLVGKGQSFAAIIDKLTDAPDVGANKTISVLVPEGYETRQIAQKLEELGMVDKDEFLRLLDKGDFDYDFIDLIDRKENRLEGYLFPATYEFFADADEYEIINAMLKAFSQNIVPIYNAAETQYTLDQIVTLASVIEREAANDSERGKVSSVFHNRLEKDMTLSSCATVQYIIKERKDVLSNSDIKIKSGYNTYINKGLPQGPIASPGTASVKAALYPENTDYLYFAARADGSENVFSKTDTEHIKTVKELQK